jgi:hypothetical protein
LPISVCLVSAPCILFVHLIFNTYPYTYTYPLHSITTASVFIIFCQPHCSACVVGRNRLQFGCICCCAPIHHIVWIKWHFKIKYWKVSCDNKEFLLQCRILFSTVGCILNKPYAITFEFFC